MEDRYDKYKDSGIAWIGEIPEHWEIRKLKNIFLLSTGTTPKEYDKISEGDNLINWYTPSDILEGCNDLFSSLRKLSEKIIYENKISLFPIGTLLYVGIGASAGKVGYANEKGYSNQQITSLIPLGCYSRFYFYYLSVLKDKIRDNAFFTTLPIINNVYLGQELIPYPLFSEQQSIATYLDQKCGEIDELITLQEEMITKLQSYKQSVITEAVTKGLDKNVPLKDSGIEWIGEIPEHWILKRIKNICNNLDYLREPISAEHRSRNNPIYDYYGASGVIDKIDYYNVDDQVLLIGEDGANLVMRNLPLVYKAKGKFWVNNHAHILKPKNDNYDFCAYAFEAADYSLFITGSAQPKLSQENLGRIKIAVPPLSEQQSIADYLDQKCNEIDELIFIKQQKIEKLKDYKKSLIFECVTGKRKVS